MNNLQIEILETFLKDSNSESALVINNSGSIVVSLNVEHDNSICAMSTAILSMCSKYLEDLESGTVKQIYIKTTDSLIVFNKIDENNTMIVFSKDGKNLGLFLRNVEETANKLQNI